MHGKIFNVEEEVKPGMSKIMPKVSKDLIAQALVADYIREHLDKSDPDFKFEVFTVWKCKVLQNWKYLISSTIHDGMYYEMTYNGDKDEWYLDAYKKFENRCIPGGNL